MAHAYSYPTGRGILSLRIQGQAPCLRESITQAFKGLLKAALAVALLAAVLVAVLADAHAATARDDAKVVISSLRAESETVTEGSDAVFILTRSGDTSAEVSVGVEIRGHRKIMSAETRRLLDPRRPDGMATFAAGSSTAEFTLSTQADIRIEGNGELILRIARAQNVSVTGARSARVLVEDDDVPEITLELRANGERVRPQGDVLRAAVDEGSPPDIQYRFVCPTAGYEYGVFDWGTSFPWVAGEYDGRHPIWKSYGNIFRYVCNRDGTRFLHNSWAGPTNGEINLHLVSANPDNWINEVDPSHLGYRYAVNPDSVSFGRCRGEFCPRYRIGSPNRIEITLLNANPVISVEALDAEVEEGDTARFRLTRHWPDDRWNEEFLNEALATTLVLLGSSEFGEATNESLPTQHSFGVREGSVVFEVPTIEDESPDSGERSITIEVLPDTTPQGVNPAAKYNVVDSIPGVTPEGGSARTATVRIREDDDDPTIHPAIEISDATAVEGANSIEFTVTLDQAAGLDASVDWNLSLGTATAGEDYVVVSGTLSFPAGSTTATIDVPLIDDRVVEDSETFTVTLSNPVNVRLMENAVETPEISAYGTIEDNDEPSTEVAVSLSIHEVAESAGIRGGIVAVSASLNNAAFAQDTVLVVRVGDGTAQAPEDYARLEDFPLTLEAGATSGSASFTLRPVDDSIDEDDETISVAVTSKSDLEIVWNGASELVIADDDTRGVAVSPVSLMVDEGATATYTVQLTSEPTGNVSVAPFHEGGDPDIAASPVLAFDSLNWHLAQTVTVTAAEDPDAKDDVAAIGHRVSGADYGTVAAESVAVTVTDDETESSEVLLAADPSVVREGSQAVPITVTARLASGSRDVDTVIGISVAPGSAVEGADYAAVPPFAITIPAGVVSGTQAFSFSAAPDDLDEPAETVRIAGAVSDAALAVSSALLTIEDGNAAPTVSLKLSDDSIGEAGGESTVTAFMSHASSAETTVTIAVAPVEPAKARDFRLSGTTLSIPAGWTTSSGAIVITALDNDVDARDKTLTISGTVADRLGLASPADVSLTITDDDTRGVAVSPVSLMVDEGATATYTVQLTSEPTGNVSVTPFHEGGDPDIAASPVLAFDSLNWHLAQTVTVTAAEDPDAKDDVAAIGHRVSGADYGTVAAESVAVTVTDDETESSEVLLAADPSVVREGSQAVPITVTARLASGSRDVDTVIGISVVSGSAVEGADYAAVPPFAITIPAGAVSGTHALSFSSAPDDLDEPPETVRIAGAVSDAALAVSSALLTIEDGNAAPIVSLKLSDDSIEEAGGESTVTAFMSHASSAETTVTIAVAPVEPAKARDFTLSGTTLSIPAGWTTSSGAIVITAKDNDVNARNKTLIISGTVANRLGLADPAEVSLTITDDDRASVSASPASLLVMEEDAFGAVYSVVLDSVPLGPVTVSVTGMAGSDVSVSPTRLAFTPSNWDEAQKVQVTAGADDDSRDDRVVLEHHAAGGGYGNAGMPRVAVVVFDKDRRIALSVDPPNIGEGTVATDIVVTATHAEEAADAPVTVHVTVGRGPAPNPAIAGSDFEPVGSFAIVIPDGAESGTGTFTFTPIEDEEVEEDEVLFITGASDTPSVAVSGAELVITDNDEHPLRALSILDSTAGESDGSISFQVRLDAASSALVRVRYATEDDTALAGIDYEPRSGILAIAPGALSAELTVPVRMDSVDEGKERFRVRLSDPEHAILADSEAIGTIANADPLPSTWLIRFGQSVAEDIAESVASRAETAQASGVEVEIANQFLGGLPDAALDGGNGNFTRSWPVTHEEFLDGSSIKATKAVADGGVISVWGSGSVSRFTGTEQGVSLEGESSTGILGADYRSGSRAIGFLLSRSTGKGTYGSGDGGGRISAKMAGLYPFFHVHPMDRYSIWGVAGHGRGKIRLEPREGPASEAGISMAMAALGTRGVVGNASGIDVAVETDGFLVRTRSETAPGLSATDSQAGRVRVGLEGSAPLEIDGFGSIVPSVGIGMRYDSGDAESGYGFDLGGGLALDSVRTGISVELQGRALLVHEAERVSDWGWSGTLHFDPAPSSDRGVDFSLSSSRGASTGGRADALRNVETVGGLLAESTGSPATSIDAEIGYGVLVADGKFTARPAIGIGTSGSARTYRTGYTLRLARRDRIDMELGLEAYRRIGVEDREHGARVEVRLHW